MAPGEQDKSGDWRCGECGTRNFARRTECFKCGASREEAGRSLSRSRSASRGKSGGKGKKGDKPEGKRSRSRGRRSRSRPGDGGGKGSKSSRGKDKSEGGGKSKDNPDTARNLYLEELKKGRRARSSSSGSSDAKPKRTRQMSGSGFDSFVKAPEAKPAAAPKKKKNAGLEIEIGGKVDIHGLAGAAQYNGHEGRVVAGPNEKGRWKVELTYQGEQKDIALKPENLQPKPTCGWELVVAAIPESASEADVTEAFKQFGSVVSCKVTRDENGVSKSVALVVMNLKENAEKALSPTVEIKVSSVPAKVQWSTMVKTQMGLLKNRDEECGDEGASTRKFQEAPAPEKPKYTGPFDPGQAVEVSGLTSAPQYNNAIGIVQGFRADGRCEVQFVESGKEAKTLALKVQNLHAVGKGAKPRVETNERKENDEPPKHRRFSEGLPQTKAPVADASPAAPSQPNVQAPVDPTSADATSNASGAAPRRRRASLWGEGNDGGQVYVGTGTKTGSGDSTAGAAVSQSGGVAGTEASKEAEGKNVEPIPDEATLQQMSAKELKKLLLANSVDVAGCFEKAEFLEKAKKLVQR